MKLNLVKYISKRYKCRICGFDSESPDEIEKHLLEGHKDKLL